MDPVEDNNDHQKNQETPDQETPNQSTPNEQKTMSVCDLIHQTVIISTIVGAVGIGALYILGM